MTLKTVLVWLGGSSCLSSHVTFGGKTRRDEQLFLPAEKVRNPRWQNREVTGLHVSFYHRLLAIVASQFFILGRNSSLTKRVTNRSDSNVSIMPATIS